MLCRIYLNIIWMKWKIVRISSSPCLIREFWTSFFLAGLHRTDDAMTACTKCPWVIAECLLHPRQIYSVFIVVAHIAIPVQIRNWPQIRRNQLYNKLQNGMMNWIKQEKNQKCSTTTECRILSIKWFYKFPLQNSLCGIINLISGIRGCFIDRRHSASDRWWTVNNDVDEVFLPNKHSNVICVSTNTQNHDG